jgi:hypothetical protein
MKPQEARRAYYKSRKIKLTTMVVDLQRLKIMSIDHGVIRGKTNEQTF